MVPKKKKHSPSKKVKTAVLTSEDQQQIQQLLTEYQTIVTRLLAARSPEEAETALTPIEELSEDVQMAFTRSLSNKLEIQAADMLTALYAFARHKEVRKEAKRSLLRLASANIEPDWSAPQDPPKISSRALQAPLYPTPTLPERYQGKRSTQAEDFNDLNPSDHEPTEEEVDELTDLSTWSKEELGDLEEILEEDEGPPDPLYYELSEADRETLWDQMEEAIKPWLDGEEVVEMRRALPPRNESPTNTLGAFFDAFTRQMYDQAYNLLAEDSPLRGNISQQEWVRQYNEWSLAAQPDDYDLYILYKPWYEGLSEGQQGFELYWSLHITSQTFPWGPENISEISMLDHPYFHRHWFRSRAVMVERDGEYKLYTLFDYSSSLRNLSDAELVQRWEESRKICEDLKPLVDQQKAETDLVQYMILIIAYQQRLNPLLYLGMERTRREPANSEIYDTVYKLSHFPEDEFFEEILIAFLERKLASDQQDDENTVNRLIYLYSILEEQLREAEQEEQAGRMQTRLEDLFTRLFKITGSDKARLQRLINRLRYKSALDEVEPEIQALETASIDPDLRPEYTFQLGQYYLHYERLELALSYLLQAQALGHDSYKLIRQIASIQIKLKRFKNAITTLQQIETRDYDTDLLLARALLELGQYKKALTIAEKHARQFDEMALPAAVAAMASYRLGNTRVARNYLRAAEKNAFLEPEAQEMVEKAQHLIH